MTRSCTIGRPIQHRDRASSRGITPHDQRNRSTELPPSAHRDLTRLRVGTGQAATTAAAAEEAVTAAQAAEMVVVAVQATEMVVVPEATQAEEADTLMVVAVQAAVIVSKS